MTNELRKLVEASELVGLGEQTHGEPAYGQARNEVFTHLVGLGFRSFALETDRVAALAVDRFVRHRNGTLEEAMSEGLTHRWYNASEANRRLISRMREYNDDRPEGDRVSFHGIDAPVEFAAASPRRDLECARDYLGLDLDIVGLAGDDDRWSRTEAVMDPAASPGEGVEAVRLRAIADDMRIWLYARAPELIAATSLADWHRARIHLDSGLGLLRYHRQAAQPIPDADRWSRLSGTRDALMAQNLLDIRDLEAGRGPTMVSAHNAHLQRNRSTMPMAGMDLTWFGTGAVLASLMGDRYTFIAGSSGRGESEMSRLCADEGSRPDRSWELTAPDSGTVALDRATLDGAAAVLHVREDAAEAATG